MHETLRALLITWRDRPSKESAEVALRALAGAGMIPSGDDTLSVDDAALWLEVLDGVPSPVEGPLQAALAEEAGGIDLAGELVDRLTREELPEGWMSGLLDAALDGEQHEVASLRVSADPALRAELAGLAEVGRWVREAVAFEAGACPRIWTGVAPELGFADPESVPGWDAQLVAEAVRAEAGSVDVADKVMSQVRRGSAAVEPTIPMPANARNWTLAALAMAAAVSLWALVAPSLFDPAAESDSPFVERSMEFASASELALEGARYGENASVFVQLPEGPDAPVIIWVDDGAQL